MEKLHCHSIHKLWFVYKTRGVILGLTAMTLQVMLVKIWKDVTISKC